MTRPSLRAAIRQFRLGRSTLGAAVLSLILGLLGHGGAVLGLWIGVSFYIANLFLLHEAARSLITARSRRTGRSMAIGASVGRLLLLGVLLSFVGIYLGRETLLGACGGLLITQVALSLPRPRISEAM